MPPLTLTCDPHPLLWLGAFVAALPGPLADTPSPDWLRAGLRLDFADAPLPPADDGVRQAVRALLRHGGFKPSGRSKPASEFLLRAAGDPELGLDSINLAVDLCNVVSLHSGLPISVVDLDRVTPPLRAAVVDHGSYVFNASGQEIKLDGLLCLHDADGPCANPVKDSQRSKTQGDTRTSLCVLWGAQALAERSAATLDWYRALHLRAGATLHPVVIA